MKASLTSGFLSRTRQLPCQINRRLRITGRTMIGQTKTGPAKITRQTTGLMLSRTRPLAGQTIRHKQVTRLLGGRSISTSKLTRLAETQIIGQPLSRHRQLIMIIRSGIRTLVPILDQIQIAVPASHLATTGKLLLQGIHGGLQMPLSSVALTCRGSMDSGPPASATT